MVKRTRCVLLAVMVLQAVFFTTAGYGFKAEDIQKLNSTNKCEKCDLSNADLSGLDMYGAQLTGANLTGANLSDASFNDANLTEANLTGANIKGANFSGAKLSNAIWTDGRKCASGSMGKCK
ncbi:MAG TPA: pentapeptide repeat-containing protein [Syntrophorhabdaceae bacterium]|nr:pentapeptide repeat-containing protein [Syntrophorhabdaceae bacterium]HQM81866.1 pentapeptide repeat-containing protein [Syntrophorhabdaceae bacterium]